MTAAPRIETDRLVLRPHRMEDFAAMAAFFASDAAGFVGGPMPAPRAWHRFAADVGSWDLWGSAPGRSRRRRPAPSPASWR